MFNNYHFLIILLKRFGLKLIHLTFRILFPNIHYHMKFSSFKLGFTFWVLLVGFSVVGQTKPGETRSHFKEWLDTEKAISREKEDWNARKVWLNEHISLTQRELVSLKEKIAEFEEKASTTDEQRLKLLDREAILQQQQKRVTEILVKLEHRLQQLRPGLPEPLLQDLELAYHKLPAAGAETSIGLADRLQNVIGVLSDIFTFDKKITITESLHQSADGTEYLVTVLYLGLGQAYFIGTNDAGIGFPSSEGWKWESQPNLSGKIKKAIDMAQGTTGEVTFVDLPVKLQKKVQVSE